jgi:hypothetical protein
MSRAFRVAACRALVTFGVFLVGSVGPARGDFRSHPPTRPLPASSSRPLTDGRHLFVDPVRGDDAADGSQARPWRTLAHAVGQLEPGDTLCLRGGTYYEHVTLSDSGTPQQAITLRAYPGELAVIDGGLREFFENPAGAWEPCPDGAAGEFRSTRAYRGLGGREDATRLLGNFGDSLVPLHGYHWRGDLQSDNPYWTVTNKVGGDEFVYCGPGVWYDLESGRIHVRLAHTRLEVLGEDNYRGETDPRKLPLVIAGHGGGSPLTLDGVRHVRLQDLVIRGARDATLTLQGCADVELDGLTLYGGSTPLLVRDTVALRMQHCACRGLAAPWTFRGSLKYRAIESRLLNASGWDPTGAEHRDFEIAYCEFTDSVDGVFLGNVRGVRFHHNLLDNVSDDGVFLTAATAYDGTTPGGDVRIYQNRLARCLTTFAFGVGHGRQKTTESGKQLGAGVWIYRNVFDFRRPVMYHWPTGPDEAIDSTGRVAGDHGGPGWEPMTIYHNTILAGDPPRYDYGTDGLGKAMGHGTRRRVFNNVISQMHGLPGQFLPPADVDFQADGTLCWSVSDGPAFAGEWLAKFRGSEAFARSRDRYEPGWTANDIFADPRFQKFSPDWHDPVDLRPGADSPAVNAGVLLPADWPDPLREQDETRPDIGALPRDGAAWRVGVRGRIDVFGNEVEAGDVPEFEWSIPLELPPTPAGKAAAIVRGYPAFDAPLIEYALRQRGAPVEVFERTWLDTRDYGRYGLVVIDGSLLRGKVEPSTYADADLPRLRRWLDDGGTLLLMRERTDVFRTNAGRAFLAELVGEGGREPVKELTILRPDDPWVRHIDAGRNADNEFVPVLPWLEVKRHSPLRTSRGEAVIGTANGAATLYRVPVGRGQLIYVGWSPAAFLPNGRVKTTVEQERLFAEQMRILTNIVTDDAAPDRTAR